VATATGTFTLTVIRDVTEARKLADLADLARAAVAARQAHDSQELLDSVTTGLYHVGLSLQAAADLPHDAASKGIAEALRRLDDTIRQIRDSAFTTGGPQNLSRTPKRCRATPRRGVPETAGRPFAGPDRRRQERASTGSERPLTNTATSLICEDPGPVRRAAPHSPSYRSMPRVMPGSRARYPER
jgi:hypothetical protein